MQNVAVMECGDGLMRADNASFGPAVAKTASYTILPDEQTQIFTNLGAAGSVTFTLPAAAGKTGRRYLFLKATAGQTVVVTGPAASSMKTYVTPFTGIKVTHSTADEFGTFEVVSYNGVWQVVSQLGTWAFS